MHFWQMSHYVAEVCLSLEQFFCLSLPCEREREIQRDVEKKGGREGHKLPRLAAFSCKCIYIFVFVCLFELLVSSRIDSIQEWR